MKDYTEQEVVSHHGDPLWEAIKSAIWDWDIERTPGAGHAHSTGTDVTHIYDAVKQVTV